MKGKKPSIVVDTSSLIFLAAPIHPEHLARPNFNHRYIEFLLYLTRLGIIHEVVVTEAVEYEASKCISGQNALLETAMTPKPLKESMEFFKIFFDKASRKDGNGKITKNGEYRNFVIQEVPSDEHFSALREKFKLFSQAAEEGATFPDPRIVDFIEAEKKYKHSSAGEYSSSCHLINSPRISTVQYHLSEDYSSSNLFVGKRNFHGSTIRVITSYDLINNMLKLPEVYKEFNLNPNLFTNRVIGYLCTYEAQQHSNIIGFRKRQRVPDEYCLNENRFGMPIRYFFDEARKERGIFTPMSEAETPFDSEKSGEQQVAKFAQRYGASRAAHTQNSR